MAEITPAGFKKLVKRVTGLEAPVFQEYRADRDGRTYKIVTFTLHEEGGTTIRVDYFRGEAEGHFFNRNQAYHRPPPVGAIDLRKLSKATALAADILEAFYGSAG